MKKILIVLCMVFAGGQLANAQINFGLKGGINYNSDSFSEVKNDVLAGAKSKTGFHAGVWLRGKLPVIGLYIRPELVYTQLQNEVAYSPSVVGATSTKTTYSFKKLDLPVLLGKKIFGIGNIFAGPSFQYILGSDFDLADLKEIKSDGFSVGLQLGLGVEFGNFGVDVRWERALSDSETKFVNNNTNTNLNFDTRVNQIILSVSLEL